MDKLASLQSQNLGALFTLSCLKALFQKPYLMNKYILVVDDDFANRILPGLFLRDMGHTVVECANAEEAFQQIDLHPFTDLLLDISMPVVSGLEICKTLRSNSRHQSLRIVAYTAHAMPEETKSFSESGFDGLLIKPICRNDLEKLFGS